ncbi:MAG TPA: [Fe-Fe] hydrogenase large subunit C-terminal domain-containing protein [Eubacteriales bacterium]|nr:[Fe-Fe] hydrogenase large subunit C-terminal domain-containing protein [Eubacteriales bacterium]
MSEVLKLKKSNCKNCYKCIRHCPVKSIRFSGNQAHIVGDECILCGQCFVVCPQNAKQIADGTEAVYALLAGSSPVVASLAPSFPAYFEGVGLSSLTAALKKLGFAAAEETAVGATLVKREYEKQLAAGEQDVIITSCCHSVNLLIRKYYPDLIKYLSPVVSPMIAHSMNVKGRMPQAKTVFIGPCLSKKDEAEQSPVDAVLTFEELANMFLQAEIELEPGMDEAEESRARLFPTVGGILKTMDIPDTGYTCLTVDGTENCKAALEDILAGNIHRCFIEMSACAGSCIGGPVMEKYKNSPVRHYQVVTSFAGKKDFPVEAPPDGMLSRRHAYIGHTQVMPSEAEIREILAQTGKLTPEDELNCGSCGYDTCREKAIAVYHGKADVSMCLPFLMERAERFTSTILSHTPNGILVVNEDLEVQQINRAAMGMMRIARESDVLGEPLVRILDPLPFLTALDGKRLIKEERSYYAEFDKYLELTIMHDKTTRMLIAIIRDVTAEEEQRRKKEEIGRQTVQIADRVVEKQMRIVQEIASLLGETTAETKIALTKLKESIDDGKDE